MAHDTSNTAMGSNLNNLLLHPPNRPNRIDCFKEDSRKWTRSKPLLLCLLLLLTCILIQGATWSRSRRMKWKFGRLVNDVARTELDKQSKLPFFSGDFLHNSKTLRIDGQGPSSVLLDCSFKVLRGASLTCQQCVISFSMGALNSRWSETVMQSTYSTTSGSVPSVYRSFHAFVWLGLALGLLYILSTYSGVVGLSPCVPWVCYTGKYAVLNDICPTYAGDILNSQAGCLNAELQVCVNYCHKYDTTSMSISDGSKERVNSQRVVI